MAYHYLPAVFLCYNIVLYTISQQGKVARVNRVYFKKSDKGRRTAYTRNLGGNMKTHAAVCEKGLFDLRGGKTFKGGQMPPLAPPPLLLKVNYSPTYMSSEALKSTILRSQRHQRQCNTRQPFYELLKLQV